MFNFVHFPAWIIKVLKILDSFSLSDLKHLHDWVLFFLGPQSCGLISLHLSWSITKPTKWPVHLAKTQISLGIRPVWSESSLSAKEELYPWLSLECTAKTDRLGRCSRLISVLAGCIDHLLCSGTFVLIYLKVTGEKNIKPPIRRQIKNIPLRDQWSVHFYVFVLILASRHWSLWQTTSLAWWHATIYWVPVHPDDMQIPSTSRTQGRETGPPVTAVSEDRHRVYLFPV